MRWKPSSKRSSACVPLGVEGLEPGMAVNGAQAEEAGGKVPDFVVAVAAAHGLVRDDQLIGPGGLPPGQQGHGLALVAEVNRPKEGHRLEQEVGGQRRGAELDARLLGLQPGDAGGGHRGLEEGGALHQEEPSLGEEIIDGVVRGSEVLVFQVNGQHKR